MSLDSSAVSDVLDGLGLPGRVLASNLRPIGTKARCAGRAVCAQLIANTASDPPPSSGYLAAIDAAVRPDCVLVLQAPMDGAVLGGLMAREFRRLGAAGVLTDGNVRDASEICALGLPVIAAGTSARNGAREMRLASIGQSINLPGEAQPVPIENGDYIVADDDGIVVIPAAVAVLVIEATLQLAEIEQRIGREMDAGRSRLEAMRLHDRFAHLAPLRARLKLDT
jgi:4-hydroxy-4-methyl-2-oxoglutarate aldolase